MVLKDDQAKVQALLKEAITVLCKNGLTYRSEFSVEGLLGITLDNEEVFLISINEVIKGDFPTSPVQQTPKPMPPMRQRPIAPKPRTTPIKPARPQVQRKRTLSNDLSKTGSNPATPTHSSPGVSPQNPGTPQQQQLGFDSDQPPVKRLHEDDGTDELPLEDGKIHVKSEPGTEQEWDPSFAGQDQQDPNAAMQVCEISSFY